MNKPIRLNPQHPAHYKCKSKENNGKHIFVIPELSKGNEYVGVCKLCGNERVHTMGFEDSMASGRKASKEKLEAKKRKEKLEKHINRREFMNTLTRGFNTDVN